MFVLYIVTISLHNFPGKVHFNKIRLTIKNIQKSKLSIDTDIEKQFMIINILIAEIFTKSVIAEKHIAKFFHIF